MKKYLVEVEVSTVAIPSTYQGISTIEEEVEKIRRKKFKSQSLPLIRAFQLDARNALKEAYALSQSLPLIRAFQPEWR